MELTIPVLLITLLGIALIDSINPSALFVTGYILTKAPSGQKIRAVIAYVAGIFTLYLLLGIGLTLGLAVVLGAVSGFMESRLVYVIQAVVGAALFGWSLLPPRPVSHLNKLKPVIFSIKTMFLLGITVTLIEFITALPYIAAIGLLQQIHIDIAAKMVLLIGYNIIFILPPLALLIVYRMNRGRFERWLRARQAGQDTPSTTMQWIIGIIGVMLLLNSLGALGGVLI